MTSFFSGLLQGAVAYGAVYMIGIALGWEWTLFGFDGKDIMASVAGLGTWTYFGNRTKNQPEKTGVGNLTTTAIVVLGILAVIGYLHWKSAEHKNQTVVSITQARLSSMQMAMTGVQGAVMQMGVPFPETPEQILEIIRTHKQLFPPQVVLLGRELIEDEWGTKIGYEPHGITSYTFRSAGADKTFGTQDDLVVTDGGPRHEEK